MAQRLIIVNRCPLCGGEVDQIPDGALKKNPHEYNVEFIITRSGLKQYFHTSCWFDMIRNQRPYNGKLYL